MKYSLSDTNLSLTGKMFRNMGIVNFNVESIGLQDYNVTVQVNYFVNALMSSAVSAMFLLAGMFSAEQDKKRHVLNARIVHKEDELIIRMRDNCESFDPRKKYEQIYASEDVGSSIGIRMIMAEAKEVSYTSMFNLNNLLIRIGKTAGK